MQEVRERPTLRTLRCTRAFTALERNKHHHYSQHHQPGDERLREGLLPAGESVHATRARYSARHVEGLELIQALRRHSERRGPHNGG